MAIVLATFALSGCLSSNYNYISHRSPDKTVLYFKIPTQWKVFNADQIVESVNGHLSRSQLAQAEANEWINYFSDAPKPSLKQLNPFGQGYPAGIAIAQQLSATDADSYSFASLRAALLGSDPLASSGSGGPTYQPLSYSQFTKPGGLRGSTMQVNITQNRVITTYEQVGIIDPQTQWIFVLGVGCKASCWGANQGLIKQIVNSWGVKAR